MRLPDTLKKIKDYPDLPKDVFILLLILLVGMGSFLLGRLSAVEEGGKKDLRIRTNALPASVGVSREGGVSVDTKTPLPPRESASLPLDGTEKVGGQGMYVGSKNGQAYYLPWCGGVKRIKEENKVWFASKADAEAKGYKPAGNCKGI